MKRYSCIAVVSAFLVSSVAFADITPVIKLAPGQSELFRVVDKNTNGQTDVKIACEAGVVESVCVFGVVGATVPGIGSYGKFETVEVGGRILAYGRVGSTGIRKFAQNIRNTALCTSTIEAPKLRVVDYRDLTQQAAELVQRNE